MAVQPVADVQPSQDRPHARNYPGRSTPKAEKVSDASHDAINKRHQRGWLSQKYSSIYGANR